MKVESIHLIAFGKFANKVINFTDNLQVLIGENEAGKTTLINAILAVMYGFKGRSDNARHLKAKYKPWDTTLPYQVGLTLIDSLGDRYYIKRNLDDDTVEVLLWKDNSFIPAGKTLEQILVESLGLKNVRIFESTLLIRQEEISSLDQKQLNDAITQKITEGGHEVIIKNVFKVLEDKQKELTRGLERQSSNPGVLKSISDQIDKLQEELTNLEKYETDYAKLRKDFKDKTDIYNKISERLSFIEPMIKTYEIKVEIETLKDRLLFEQKELQNKINKIREKNVLINNIQELLAGFENIEPYLNETILHNLEQFSAKLKSIEEAIESYCKKIKLTEHQIQQIIIEKDNLTNNLAFYLKVKYSQENLMEAQRVNNQLKHNQENLYIREMDLSKYSQIADNTPKKTKLWLGLSVAILSLLGLALKNIIGYTIFGVLFVISIILISLSRKNEYQNLKLFKDQMEAEIERIKVNITNNERILNGLLGDEDLETFKRNVLEITHHERDIGFMDSKITALETNSLKDEVARLELEKKFYHDKIDNILNSAQSIDINDYREKITNYNRLEKDYHVNKEAYDFLCQDESADGLETRLAELSVELLNLNNKIESLEGNIDEGEHQRLKTENEKLILLKDELTKEIIQLDTGINHYQLNLFNGQDIWTVRNNLVENQNEYNKYLTLNKSIQLATQVMHEAVEEAQAQLAPMVRTELSRIFSYITAERYNKIDIGIDEGNLFFKVYTSKEDKYVDTNLLSTGTRDQFYLALRIALAQYLTNNKSFPLFLDDPFINFDEKRLKATIKVLEELAKNRQIIWLTKDQSMQKYLAEITTGFLL